MKKYEITALLGLLGILICIISLFYTIFTGNFPEQKYALLFPNYTGRECKECHVVRPLSWEKCDCKMLLTNNLGKQDNYTVIDTWEIEK